MFLRTETERAQPRSIEPLCKNKRKPVTEVLPAGYEHAYLKSVLPHSCPVTISLVCIAALRYLGIVGMASSHLLFPRRAHFSCNPPFSVEDDYGNCIDFVNQKWDLQGPKTLLLAGLIVSVLAGCWTLVFFGTEGRAREQASSSSTQGWFKSHSIVLAMLFALW